MPIWFVGVLALWAAAWIAVGVTYEGNTDRTDRPKVERTEHAPVTSPSPLEAP